MSRVKSSPSKVHYCLNCGHNITKDVAITVDGFYIDWRGIIAYKERRLLGFTPVEVCMIYAIAAADGRPVPNATVVNRCCSEDASPENVKVHMHKVKRKMALSKIPCHILPVKTPFGNRGGYYWCENPADTTQVTKKVGHKRVRKSRRATGRWSFGKVSSLP